MDIEGVRKLFVDMVADEDVKGNLNSEFVMIEEAIFWIGFGTYHYPSVGPKSLHKFLGHSDFAQWNEELEGLLELKFEFARDMLFAAIENGHLIAIGMETLDSERAEVDNPSIPLGEYCRRIKPADFERGGWSEMFGRYTIGRVIYAGIFVQKADLDRVFGPFQKVGVAGIITGLPISDHIVNSGGDGETGRPRGRRPKWDWELILAGVVHAIGKTGQVPEKQVDLERIIAEYCQQKFGDEPSVSSIRDKASPIFDMLRQNSQ